MDINTKNKHVSLNSSKNNPELYKRMYVIPETQYKQPIVNTSFRNIKANPKTLDLNNTENVESTKVKKKPCTSCKKSKIKKHKEVDLKKSVKIKKNPKKKLKSSDLKNNKTPVDANKKSNLKKLYKGQRDLNLNVTPMSYIEKHETKANPDELKFNTLKDYRKFLNVLYKYAMKKSTPDEDRSKAHSQMLTVKKNLEELKDTNKKNDLLNSLSEKISNVENMLTDATDFARTLVRQKANQSVVIPQADLSQPSTSRRDDRSDHSMGLLRSSFLSAADDADVQNLTRSFIQTAAIRSPILQQALAQISPVATRTRSRVFPSSLHSKITKTPSIKVSTDLDADVIADQIARRSTKTLRTPPPMLALTPLESTPQKEAKDVKIKAKNSAKKRRKLEEESNK